MSNDPLSPDYNAPPARPVGEPVPLSIPDSWRPAPPTLEPGDPTGMPLSPPTGAQAPTDTSGVQVVGDTPNAPVAPPTPPHRGPAAFVVVCAADGCGHPRKQHTTFGCLSPGCTRPQGGNCRAFVDWPEPVDQ